MASVTGEAKDQQPGSHGTTPTWVKRLDFETHEDHYGAAGWPASFCPAWDECPVMEPHPLGERLDGFKTYLAAIGFAFLGAYRLYDHRWEGAAEMFLVGLATASLRHAIARKPRPEPARFLEDHD